MAEDQGQTSQVRLAFQIGYIGTAYFGSQYQPDRRTIEGEIEAACIRAGIITNRQESRLAMSGRTDRGVHARCQILALSTSNPDRAIRAINGQLPPDIWVTSWSYAPETFYPRYDVINRTYRFYFSQVPSDIDAMKDSALLFLGKHDFTCFARIEPGKTPEKTIDAVEILYNESGLWLEITAQSFLWHMVRCIAASLMQVSEGTLSRSGLEKYLSGACKNKIKPAPPDGLILWDVKTDLDWQEMNVPGLKTRRLQNQAEELLLLGKVYSLLVP
jgi:tRNA pseudouridine38-40 synthase